MEPDLMEPGTAAVGLAVPAIAGILRVAINAGMPARFADVLALTLGVAGGVSSALTAQVPILTGIIQGAAVGLAGAGLWVSLSNKADTDGQ